MTQPQLAQKSGLGLSTIVDFEKMRRPVPKGTIGAIQGALEQAGIEFIDDNGGGEGIRFLKPQSVRKRK